MQFINSNKIRNSINEVGAKQTPFFFTIDYEMEEGLFIEHPTNQTEVLFPSPLNWKSTSV